MAEYHLLSGTYKRIELSKVKVQPGPIQHQNLSPDLVKELKHLYDHIGHYVQPTLEQWELGFMRDLRPEREIEVWKVILRMDRLPKAILWREKTERTMGERHYQLLVLDFYRRVRCG